MEIIQESVVITNHGNRELHATSHDAPYSLEDRPNRLAMVARSVAPG
jgi:hypothetical protein